MARTSVGEPLRRSLPVAGVSGTLAPRMRHTAAAGRCQAKTGSLIDVSNLAGYCRSRGGDLIAFAFFMDGPRTVTEHTLQDSMTITLARDDPRRR
jgi:D-alanyl-D-alanine carboxypeptidase/D-alanyl-D-alanine-endopeptidase (penicillin-binding protein 4)